MQLPQDLSDFVAFVQRIEHVQLHFACLGIRVRTIRDVSKSRNRARSSCS